MNMKKKIHFENAQELHKQHPDTFYAPDVQSLEKIEAGDVVKVCASNERFWAEVIAVSASAITARVANHLFIADLKYGDIIKFQPAHVYDILTQHNKKPSPSFKQASGKIIKRKGPKR